SCDAFRRLMARMRLSLPAYQAATRRHPSLRAPTARQGAVRNATSVQSEQPSDRGLQSSLRRLRTDGTRDLCFTSDTDLRTMMKLESLPNRIRAFLRRAAIAARLRKA